MGDAGILDFFLGLLDAKEVQDSLITHMLRLIGNSCADTDENRERVVFRRSIPSIINQLQNTLLLSFVINVLFNVCLDYEPAQKQASEARLGECLIELIPSPRFVHFRANLLGQVCKILALLIAQPSEPDSAPGNTPLVLLELATDTTFQLDLQDFMDLVNTASDYLQHSLFQECLISHPSGPSIVLVVLNHITNSVPIDREDAQLLSQMYFKLTTVLADMAALPSFAAAYPINSPLIISLIQLVSSAPSTDSARSRPQVVSAACLILSNLAQSDVACQALVQGHSIHIPLAALLANAAKSLEGSAPIPAQQTSLTYLVLGLLRNLAIPASNKPLLGDAGILDSTVLPRLWCLDASPQIQFTAVLLTRTIILGCVSNVRYLCRPLSPDPDSPASGKSSLHILLNLHNRTDNEATKMETARLVAAVCRVLHNPSVTEDQSITSLRQKFYAVSPDQLSGPLNYLIIQNQTPSVSTTASTASGNSPPKYPVLRSEAWTILALMAGTPEGSEVVAQCMHDTHVFSITCEILSGKPKVTPIESGSEQGAISTSIVGGLSQGLPASGNGPDEEQRAHDRSNVLIMVSQLLRHHGDQMASFRKQIFEDLLNVGAKAVANQAEVLNNVW